MLCSVRLRCCSTTAGGERRGAWRFPNGSEVEQESMGGDVYSVRSYSSVALNRKNNTLEPTGIYTCEILDADNTNRILYVRVSGGIATLSHIGNRTTIHFVFL